MGSKRDRNKNNFWNTHCGELPEEVLTAFKESLTAQMTKMLNNSIVVGPDGKYCFNLQNNFITENIAVSHDLYGNDISMGCYPTQKVSKLIKPRIRPDVGS